MVTEYAVVTVACDAALALSRAILPSCVRETAEEKEHNSGHNNEWRLGTIAILMIGSLLPIIKIAIAMYFLSS